MHEGSGTAASQNPSALRLELIAESEIQRIESHFCLLA
ncbi:hypothetical protein swp_2834 [Shewanella piezotolerans WP3]|uniref:Uncharacterized protein n=1 Tax=Shewanella piezotolerans (strain WP3 / JCM 13877) TaxID=225849 RepID=B8CPI5_SHEPW|nr:hypothetical protein swp_2834 [Shewanella piezotolerans WP3]